MNTENMKNEEMAAGEKKGMCGMGCMCGHRHGHAMKWLIRVAAILMVFWFGFILGELHTLVESNRYQHGSMMRSDRGGMMFDYGYDGLAPSAPVAPTAPTTPTPTTR
jgi:hypothetical protein